MIDEKRFSKSIAKETKQNVYMENRKKLEVSGVMDVDSFDEENVMLCTENGMLNIKGSQLKINKLSVESGEVTVEGEINSLLYTDDEPKFKGSFIKKIFR